jgi:hypothetical protein
LDAYFFAIAEAGIFKYLRSVGSMFNQQGQMQKTDKNRKNTYKSSSVVGCPNARYLKGENHDEQLREKTAMSNSKAVPFGAT